MAKKGIKSFRLFCCSDSSYPYGSHLFLDDCRLMFQKSCNLLCMKKIFVRQNCLGIICLLCLALQVGAQKVVIHGQEGWRKLAWVDYTGKVNASSSFGAMTEYQFSYR